MLVLVGSGEYLPEVDSIDKALFDRLGEPARVVCLPTAAGKEGDAMIDSWMQKGVRHYTRLGVEVNGVRVHDSATAHEEAHVDAIKNANFVYLSGGNPGYLHESLQGSPVWEAILGVYQSGGIVAGCSAGAMIMGERIAGPGGNRAGFNLLPNVVIMPHFDEFIGRMGRIGRMFSDKSMTMVGIDGRTALVQSDVGHEVLGRSQVHVFKADGNQTFGQGPIPAGLI